MNWHKKGDRLEKICRDELLKRWPNSKIIETKVDSVHGIDFAVESIGNGIAIVEVKSSKGAVKGRQMSISWIKERLTNNLKDRLREGYKKKYWLIYATYRVNEEAKDGLIVRSAKPTGKIYWEDILEDIFPNETIKYKYNDNLKRKIDICLEIENISTSDWKIARQRVKELQNHSESDL